MSPAFNFERICASASADKAKLTKIVEENFDFSPRGLIEYYNLRRPIYKNTARYGHVGVDRPECTWEKTDKVDVLRQAAGLKADASKKTSKK